MSGDYIYDKVQSLIKKHGSRDPEEIIKGEKIMIFPLNDTKGLLGMYQVILRNRTIFISADAGFQRKTVLAHELGHDQLHRNRASHKTWFHETIHRTNNSIYEREANLFAAHLLIDDDEICSLIKDGYYENELAYELQTDINLIKVKISELVRMKLIDIDPYRLSCPNSDFLKDYKPIKESIESI